MLIMQKKSIQKIFSSIILLVGIFFMTGMQTYDTKQVIVKVDNEVQIHELRGVTRESIINNFVENEAIGNYTVESELGSPLQNDYVLSLNTEKNITVNYDGESSKIKSYANNVDDFLLENSDQAIPLEEDEQLIVQSTTDEELDDGTVIDLHVAKVEDEVEEKSISYEVETIENAELPEGEENIVTPGVEGLEKIVYKVTYLDGKENKREEISTEVVTEPVTEVIEVGTKVEVEPEIQNVEEANTNPTTSTGSTWDELAQCETGGNWSSNTGNGYYGGLQMNINAWNSIAPGLGITAERPDLASKSEQIAVAQVMQSGGGWGQWPTCSSELGLI